MQVFINGDPREAREGASLADLLQELDAPSEGIAVEVNQTLVRRADFPERLLADGDQIEIVGLVGGG